MNSKTKKILSTIFLVFMAFCSITKINAVDILDSLDGNNSIHIRLTIEELNALNSSRPITTPDGKISISTTENLPRHMMSTNIDNIPECILIQTDKVSSTRSLELIRNTTVTLSGHDYEPHFYVSKWKFICIKDCDNPLSVHYFKGCFSAECRHLHILVR